MLADKTLKKVVGIPDGLVNSHLLESMDEPGRVIWLSFWTAPSKAQAFVTSPEYAVMLETMKPYLISGPEWKSYQSLVEWQA